MARRHKPYTVAEARAMLKQEDLDALSRFRGSQSDIIAFSVYCAVCGQPNKAVVHRHNMIEADGCKYLCFDCEDGGWAWMGSLLGQGTITEQKDLSTLENEARIGGNYHLANDLLFKSEAKMRNTHQNPVAEYKTIRKFPDDSLMLRLSKCKKHREEDESALWELYCDKNQLRGGFLPQ